jgi:hypothetical protein
MRQTPGSRREKINVVGSSTFGRYNKISSERTINMFISDNWLINTAGYQRIYNFFPAGQGRGIFNSIRGNLLIVVVSSFVYALDVNLVPTFIGNLATESGEVFIDENLSSQICIVDGLNAYIYNYSMPANLTVQALSGTLIPNYVEYHNTCFLFGNANRTPNGSAWYAYSFNSATTITQSAQFAIQTKPDYALAIIRLPGQGNNVLALGSSVGEIWTQVAGLQVYRRNATINLDYGVLSVSTIAKSDKYVAWLGANESNQPVIMVYAGQGFTRISTDGIDYELGQIKFPAQSTAMFYRQDGHLFYQLTFTNAADNKTYLYDFNTEKFFDLADAHLNFHPAREYVYFQGQSYFISLSNAALYESSTNFTTYNENLPTAIQDPTLNLEIQRIRICDTLYSDDSSQNRYNSLVVTIEQGNDTAVTGVSLLGNEDLLITEDMFVPPDDVIYTEFGVPIGDEDSGAGIGMGDLPPPYQPRVDLSISRDAGITWSNTVSRNLNPVAIRQNILNWEGMGACNSFTPKFRFWGISRFVVNDGIVEIY